MSISSIEKEMIEPAAIHAWAEKRMIYIELADGHITFARLHIVSL